MAMSRSFGGSRFTTRSPMRMVPELTSSSPATSRSVVDSPQPEGPTRTTNSSSSILRSKSVTAGTAPYDFSIRSNATFAIAISTNGSESGPGRSDAQPTNDVSLREQGHQHRRSHGQHCHGAHEVPLRAELGHELRHGDGDQRGVVTGEDEGEQELVPGVEPGQDRER